MYNALLCVVGVESGCQSVAEAQADSGRWFRSPHRRWMWTARCFDQEHPLSEQQFKDRCANGFSPDMGLGVMLYTLVTHEVDRYRRWLDWLDHNAASTELCRLDGSRRYDCIANFYWPRLCSHDLGYGEDPQTFTILDRYGGQCALRPFDAFDFVVVNEATDTIAPPQLNEWLVANRAAMQATMNYLATQLLGGAWSPPVLPPFLYLSARVNEANYRLHLDAVRVLLRMLINNPSLQLDDIPPLPESDDVLDQLLGQASAGGDPFWVRQTAQLIASRVDWNPFYQLLANGPTPEVRQLILSRCSAVTIDNTNWLWGETPELSNDGIANNDPRHAMGWDCVFVARLYNKMRVPKPLADQLFALFERYGNLLPRLVHGARTLLNIKDAATTVAGQTLVKAEETLNQALDFEARGHAELRQKALQAAALARQQLDEKRDQLHSREKELNDLKGRLIAKIDDLLGKLSCPPLDPFCPAAKDEIRKKIDGLRKELNELENNIKLNNIKFMSEIANIDRNRISAEDIVSSLDEKLVSTKRDLERGVLHAVVQSAQSALDADVAMSREAQRDLVRLQQNQARVHAYLRTWGRP